MACKWAAQRIVAAVNTEGIAAVLDIQFCVWFFPYKAEDVI